MLAALEEGLQLANLSADELGGHRSFEPRKVLLAGLQWKKTTMSQSWIGEQLGMKNAANVSRVIHRMNLSRIEKKVPRTVWFFQESVRHFSSQSFIKQHNQRKNLIFHFFVTCLKNKLPSFMITVTNTTPLAASVPAGGRQRLNLDQGWRFYRGDLPFPPHHAGWTKAGNFNFAPVGSEFDDAGWDSVELPHDFVLDEVPRPEAACTDALGVPFAANLHESHAYRPGAVAWYRRRFVVLESDRDRRVHLVLDGVYRDCEVWCNGHHLVRHRSGYTGVAIDLSEIVRFGAVNVLAIRVDAREHEGWWYEGGGIYRHAWLEIHDPLHLVRDGLALRAEPGLPLELTAEIGNASGCPNSGELLARLIAPDGRTIGEAQNAFSIDPDAVVPVSLLIPAEGVQSWSPDQPVLYRLQLEIRRDSAVVDTETRQIGFRSLRFEADLGFFLNGQPLKLRGMCCHQDHAGVGVAVPDTLWDWRVRRLKDMGCNAIRTAHNPMAPEFYDACDRLGMLVMDENRLLGASEEVLAQVAALVRRDRCHPSVILWSIANEETIQGSEQATRIGARMVRLVHRLDATRLVTAAIHGNLGSGLSHVLDVQGINYNADRLDFFHQAHPAMPMMVTEFSTAVQTRGSYHDDPARGHISAFAPAGAPTWGQYEDLRWNFISERPWLAGAFYWTGMDYRGEPFFVKWPAHSSQFGVLDLCGFPKDIFHAYRAWWTTEPVLHLIPHWTWPGREGQSITVRAATNAEEVELFLNDRSLGKRTVSGSAMPSWDVTYEPGTLRAVGRYAGHEQVTECVTAGAPLRLQLTADRRELNADGVDVAILTLAVLDAAGQAQPWADPLLHVSVTGGRLLGLGNGDPADHQLDRSPLRRAFRGLAQILVQAPRSAGEVCVHVDAEGYAPVEYRLLARLATVQPALGIPAPRLQIQRIKAATVKPLPLANLAGLTPEPLVDGRVFQLDSASNFFDLRDCHGGADGVVWIETVVNASRAGRGCLLLGADGAVSLWNNGHRLLHNPEATNPANRAEFSAETDWVAGPNRVLVALHTNFGRAWGIFLDAEAFDADNRLTPAPGGEDKADTLVEG